MKRSDIHKAVAIEKEIGDIECRLAHFRGLTKINISSACCLELQDYPEPSLIGACFRGVKASICGMLEDQLAEATRRLNALGVHT